MSPTQHTLKVKVIRSRALGTDTDVWVGLPIDAPGSVSGDTLTELFEEVEAIKHFVLGLPKDTPVTVEYVYDLPGVQPETLASYREAWTRLEERAQAVVAELRAAGLSEADSAALLHSSERCAAHLQPSA